MTCPRGPRSCSQAPWCRPDRGRSAWARRSRHPTPKCPPPPVSASRVVPLVRVDALRGERGCVEGTTEHCGCADGRPRRGGHARSRRARPCRAPTQLFCGPDPPPDGDHRTVALHPTGRARPQVREVKASISQRAHRIGHRPTPPPRDRRRAKRGRGHPTTGGHTPRRGEAGSRASPTDRREPPSRIAPTPPTRGHDPIQRLPMAAFTTISTRNSGSCARRSRVAVVHGCRRSHGQPTQRIMCTTTPNRLAPVPAIRPVRPPPSSSGAAAGPRRPGRTALPATPIPRP
jgi:hypothetical protein